ncbi:hypothetical protein [Citricoccus nitrophenolicus]|uniref:hypothetical protein n=1 Tax=Citricoccus nitrophenolicus TaxID=863575 RepID=UPI0031E7D1EF
MTHDEEGAAIESTAFNREHFISGIEAIGAGRGLDWSAMEFHELLDWVNEAIEDYEVLNPPINPEHWHLAQNAVIKHYSIPLNME